MEFSIAITTAADRTSAVRLVREVSALSVAEITRRIGTAESVAEFDTRDFPIEQDNAEGIAAQQRRVVEFLARLQECGATTLIRHHAGEITETISPEMLSNLFASDLQALEQQHD